MTAPDLTPRQRRAIEALLATGEVTQAASAARVSRDTVYRWLRQPAFAAALDAGEREALENISRALVRLGERAITALEETLAAPDMHPSTRVRAADVVLGRLLQLRELVTLEERVARLEQEVANGSKKAN